jgi:putative DNA primase/helicase
VSILTPREAAIEYVTKRGWGVIATSPGSKIPVADKKLQPNGSKSWTKDLKVIEKLYKLYPKAGVAVVTGEVSNLTVVDLDSVDVMPLLKEAGLKIPPDAYKVRTPRGFHIYLEYDPELKQTAGSFMEHLDIRSQGGYVIAPPTQMPDNKLYEVALKGEPGTWPELTAYSQRFSAKPSANGTGALVTSIGEQPGWVTEALAGMGEGRRNDVAARLAGYFHSKRIGEDIARQILEGYRTNCNPEMPSLEMDNVVRSIYRRYQIAPDSYSNEDIEPPVIDSSIANRRVIRWGTEDLVCDLSRIYSAREGVTCWIKFSTSAKGKLYGPIRLNLLSSSARDSLVRQLNRRSEKNWTLILDQITSLVTDSMDEQSESYDMRKYQLSGIDTSWCIKPMASKGVGNIIFGAAGQGKSTFVLALMLSKATGRPFVPGIVIDEPGAVMMLDWEDTPDAFYKTCSALLAGAGIDWQDVICDVRYHNFAGPLQDQVDIIQREVSEYSIELLVVDSLVASSGMDANDAESARIYHQIIGGLGENITAIGVTHIAKSGNESNSFGSVYWDNLSRNNWLLAREEEELVDNSSVIALTHKKSNRTSLMKPIGYKVGYETDGDGQATKIWYEDADLALTETLSKKLSTTDQILSLIRDIAMAPGDIAEELGMKTNTVRQALLRARDRGGLVTLNSAGQWKRKQDDVTE